jgi:hypothetical protein
MIAGSTGIGQWTDKSLLGNHALQAGAPQPTFTAASTVGTGVAFATQYFTGTLTLTGGNFSVFAVMSMSSSTGGTGRILSVAAAGATDNAATGSAIIRRNGAATQQVGYYYGGAGKTATTIVYDVPFLISHVVTAGALSTRLNGGAAATSAAAINLAVTRYSIGVDMAAAGVGVTIWNGNMHELIIVPAALADADRDVFEGYLGNKWTRTLDSAHTYVSTPP